MYGCFVTPPDDAAGDLGVVFFHNEGYSTACGHGTIALVTWAIDSGRIAVEPGSREVALTVDVPSGRLACTARLDDAGRVDGRRLPQCALVRAGPRRRRRDFPRPARRWTSRSVARSTAPSMSARSASHVEPAPSPS